MKNPKPKKGSKVLCISEHPQWAEVAFFPPQIGWVYLVDSALKMTADFSEEDPKGKRLGVRLIGAGIFKKDPDCWMAYPAECFRVVGKGKVISAQ